MTTTLIIGCGYLGRRVGRRLARRHETVFGTTRSPAKAEELTRLGIRPVVADVLDPASLASLPAADRVLYCVGLDRAAGVPMRQVYVEGLRCTLDTLKNKVARFVYVSSTSVYGGNDGGWVDEGSPAVPTTESGRIILEAESILPDEAIVIRYSGLYGPGRIVRRAALERGEPIVGDPEKWLNLIHIEDAASAAIAALDHGTPGRIYLASDDNPLPRRRYYELAAAALGAPPPRFVAAGPGSPEALRDGSNKRIANRRITSELGLRLEYPHVEGGLIATIDEERFLGASGAGLA